MNPDRHQEVKKYTDGDTAILFVHGIQGSPCQFRFLTDVLEGDVSFYNLLLPGHGSDCRAFGKSGIESWQRAVTNAASQLKNKYKKVYFVGHSMGCLLGLRAYLTDHIAFDGMMLISCPLKLRFTLRYLTHNHLTVIVKNSKNLYMHASEEANSISARHPFQYIRCFHPYVELLKLIKITRSELRKMPISVHAVHMERDEIVSARSMDILAALGDISRTTYPVCGHNYFTVDAKKSMAAMLKKMIGR